MNKRTTVVSLTLFVTLLFPSLASAAALSATQIQAVLSLLQAFGLDAGTIANVQSALGGSGSPAPQSNCLTLENNLYLDQTDANTNGEVTKLQQFLGGRVTGYFGPATLLASIARRCFFGNSRHHWPWLRGTDDKSGNVVRRFCSE